MISNLFCGFVGVLAGGIITYLLKFKEDNRIIVSELSIAIYDIFFLYREAFTLGIKRSDNVYFDKVILLFSKVKKQIYLLKHFEFHNVLIQQKCEEVLADLNEAWILVIRNMPNPVSNPISNPISNPLVDSKFTNEEMQKIQDIIGLSYQNKVLNKIDELYELVKFSNRLYYYKTDVF